MDRSQCGARSNAAGTPQHGTASAYQNFYCRCPDARELYRLHLKRRREGRLAPLMLDSLGTARRLRALAYLGWTTEALAKWFAEHPELLKGRTVRGGMSASRLNGLRNPTYKRIWAPQAELIGISYTALSATPAPNTTEAQRLRKYAKRAGWAPPLAWDDNIDDAHAQPQHLLENHNDEGDDGDMHVLLAGHVKHPTSFETPADHWRWRNLLVRAIHVLAERGFSLDEISVRLNISERQVVRLKKIDDGQLCRASRFNKKAPPAGTTPSTGTPREAHVA